MTGVQTCALPISEINPWIQKVINEILWHIDFIITEVNNLEVINDLLYERKEYGNIIDLTRKQDWEGLNNIKNKKHTGFREYLQVVRFFDQSKKPYVVTIYDSDELWQDPEIIDIFPINN